MGNELRHPLMIRILHWINMFSITSLIFSGLYIHAPMIFNVFSNIGTARKVHFIFMYISTFGLISRLYYAFATGDSKNFRFTFKDINSLYSLMKYYLFLSNQQPQKVTKYNSGQKLFYTLWVILLVIQITTGLVLYLPEKLYSIAYIFGGFGITKTIHYVITWVFILTVSLHVYLDISEGMGVVKSMITGRTSKEEIQSKVTKPYNSDHYKYLKL